MYGYEEERRERYEREEAEKKARAAKLRRIIGWSIGAVFALILLISSVYYVSPGYRGVLVTLGKVDQQSYMNGIGFKVPFVSRMYKMDVRTQKMSQKTATYTSDIQTAEIEYTFTYDLIPDNVHTLYETVGKDYESKKIIPVLNDVLKDVIGKWQAQELVSNRDKARVEALAGLQDKLDNRFFQNITIQFINIDYSDNFEGAIEDKVIAEQKAQEAVNNTNRIKEEANQKVITAKAEAEAMEIKAQALAKNKGLVEYEAVQKWNGQLPQYMMGDAVPFINFK